MRLGILTVSDRVSHGQMEDRGGAAIAEVLGAIATAVEMAVVADERALISEQLTRWCDSADLDVIVTTGGTGLGPRDVTPEATADVTRMRVPGIEEALRAQGLRSTPAAMLSRGMAAVRGTTLIVNLPGSPAAAREGAEVLSPVLAHAVALLHGNTRHG